MSADADAAVDAVGEAQDGGPGPVVVGIDGVEESRAALTWAATEAARRGTWLHVVHAAPQPVYGDVWTGGYAPLVLEELEAVARRTVEAAAEVARQTSPVRVRTHVSHESPRKALLTAAAGAQLVVTGARRRGRGHSGLLGGFVLGSTSLFIASRTPCPAVVVREEPAAGARGVVVGWDGSAQAEAALRWAADRATATDGDLLVLTVWRAPADRATGFDPGAFEDARRAAGEDVDRRVQDVLDRLRREHPGLRVQGRGVEDTDPGDVLLAAAEDAELLVVGARGHGAFVSALLGSTSHDVLHRATCPVVVVPDAGRAAEHRGGDRSGARA
ncbi:universal stress protein [Kineococcus sp. LSe6-4]|uniref:Universal stress protein n=1 Tax=Kineococcus halophytocola TaxID=3234027 RepID=A0ABV4GZU3_9ACTN